MSRYGGVGIVALLALLAAILKIATYEFYR